MMRIRKKPIPDECYIKINCDKCERLLAKYLEIERGFIAEENFKTLCDDCFHKLK